MLEEKSLLSTRKGRAECCPFFRGPFLGLMELSGVGSFTAAGFPVEAFVCALNFEITSHFKMVGSGSESPRECATRGGAFLANAPPPRVTWFFGT